MSLAASVVEGGGAGFLSVTGAGANTGALVRKVVTRPPAPVDAAVITVDAEPWSVGVGNAVVVDRTAVVVEGGTVVVVGRVVVVCDGTVVVVDGPADGLTT